MSFRNPSRVRRLAVGAAIAIGLAVGPMSAAPASATSIYCDPEIEAACFVVGTVVCKVVYKGRPCLA